MFVVGTSIPPKGAAVNFEIDLNRSEFPVAMRVTGVGRVVRVGRNSMSAEAKGFAIVNVSYQVQEPQERSSQSREAVNRIRGGHK
jgi:hypothetical protein